jgi:hypothetical protein
MAGEGKVVKLTITEIALLAVLVFMVALIRVYYGGNYAPMVVWKGELTFHDTLVNLGEIVSLPRDVLVKDHRSVLYQLEDMDVIQGTDVELESIRNRRRWHGRHQPEQNKEPGSNNAAGGPERASPQESQDK